jgi:hypothetical protein
LHFVLPKDMASKKNISVEENLMITAFVEPASELESFGARLKAPEYFDDLQLITAFTPCRSIQLSLVG